MAIKVRLIYLSFSHAHPVGTVNLDVDGSGEVLDLIDLLGRGKILKPDSETEYVLQNVQVVGCSLTNNVRVLLTLHPVPETPEPQPEAPGSMGWD